ncbi:MAG: hypothetical protein K2H84_04255 [Paramuribaculum sp.]|nr:hypothetical protein [Paramuribaculum sp.]
MTDLRAPWWIVAIIILFILPAGQFPVLLANCPPEPPVLRTMVWIYPFYVVVAAYLAYLCYPRRQLMTWILLALMAMTHVAMWMLVFAQLNI